MLCGYTVDKKKCGVAQKKQTTTNHNTPHTQQTGHILSRLNIVVTKKLLHVYYPL